MKTLLREDDMDDDTETDLDSTDLDDVQQEDLLQSIEEEIEQSPS